MVPLRGAGNSRSVIAPGYIFARDRDEVVWTEGNTIGLRFLKDPKQIAADIEQGLRKAPKPGASPAV